MKSLLKIFIVSILVLSWGDRASSRELPRDVRDRIDSLVAEAYRSAAGGFPCRIKTRGKPRILRWEEIDRCMNEAAARVDWNVLASKVQALRSRDISDNDLRAALQESLSKQALAYDRIFTVKGKDVRALMPLTNSLLKYLPPGSLMGLPVTDRAGQEVGTFAGIYSYERSGGLASANMYRLTLFQYKDRNGSMQSSADKLLLDSFGVPWEKAKDQPGFRLPLEDFFP